ncbi:MAG: DUF4446 family protein, partial [Candidatus Limnocylindria bacterium]
DLNQWLLSNAVLVVGAVVVAMLGLGAAVIVLGRRLSRATAAYRSILHESTGSSLGKALDAQAGRVEAMRQRLSELDGRYAQLETRSRGSLQHVGLVRFNPFQDTGSDQSFAIALLDDERSGIVVSSLHGRDGTRIFAKSIQAGQATHPLSDEEQKALAIASAGPGYAGTQRDR